MWTQNKHQTKNKNPKQFYAVSMAKKMNDNWSSFMQSFNSYIVLHSLCNLFSFWIDSQRCNVMQCNAIRCDVMWWDGWLSYHREEKNPWQSRIVDQIDVKVCIFFSLILFFCIRIDNYSWYIENSLIVSSHTFSLFTGFNVFVLLIFPTDLQWLNAFIASRTFRIE